MIGTIERISTVADLPQTWDNLCDHYFQKRTFLSHCQTYNPCGQRYYGLIKNSQLIAGAIVYTLQLDLLTYLRIKSPLRMQIIGVPCSVSPSGMVGDATHFNELIEGIFCYEKGLVLCLNLDGPIPLSKMVLGRTWPTIEFINTWTSWEDYRLSLRSTYRRRLMDIETKAATFDITSTTCNAFNSSYFPLYEAVFAKSSGKLEKLTEDFFCHLPTEFRLTTYIQNKTLLGWTITVQENDSFYFFLGGQDYSIDPESVYLVKILTILKQGIEANARTIELGQSAEVPKTRFGGCVREKVMLARHHHPCVHGLLRMGAGLLSYNRQYPTPHVFKRSTL